MINNFDYPFDGIWIDMNEVGVFSFGRLNISESSTDNQQKCKIELSQYPYLPQG